MDTDMFSWCFSQLVTLSSRPDWPNILRVCLDSFSMQVSREKFIFDSLRHTVGDELALKFFFEYALLCPQSEHSLVNLTELKNSLRVTYDQTHMILTDDLIQEEPIFYSTGQICEYIRCDEQDDKPIKCKFCDCKYGKTDAALKHVKKCHSDEHIVKGGVNSYSEQSCHLT